MIARLYVLVEAETNAFATHPGHEVGVDTMVARFTRLYDELLAERGVAAVETVAAPRLASGQG